MANRTNRGPKGLLLGMVVAVAAAVSTPGWAHPGPAGHGGAMGGPGLFMMASPERIDRAVDRWLDPVQATDAQRSQVKQIAQAAARDLQAQREAGRGLREQARALYTAPVVDEAAIEQLRQQMLRQHDAASQRISRATVEIARVLTPEQRVQLAERMDKRREHRKDHRKDRTQGALPASVPMT